MTPITVNGGSGITFSPSGTALNVTGNLASLLGSSSFPILTTPLGTISGGPYTSTAFNNIITSTIYRVLYTASSTSLQFASLASAIINTAGDSSPPVAPSYNFRSALESGASTVGFSNSPLTDMNGQSADLSAAASGQGTNVTLGSAGSSSVILDISNLNEVGGGFTVDGGIGTFLGLVDSIVGISTLAIISTGGTPGALYLNNMNNTYTGGTQLFSGSVYLSNTSLPDGTQVGGGNLYLQSGSTVGTTQLGAPTIAVSSGIFSIDSGSTVNTDLDLYQAGTGTGTFMSGAGGGTIQGSLYLGPYHQAAVAPTMTPVAVNGQYGITLNSTALNVTGMLSSLQGLGPFPILTTSLGSISGGPYISTAFNGLPTSALYTVQYLSNAINLTFAAAANAIINTAGDGATPLPPSYNFRSALGSGDNVGFSSSPNMNGQLAYLSLPVGQGTNVTIGSASISSIILDLSNLNTGGFTVDGGGTLGLADGSGGPGSLSIVSTTGGVGTLYLNNMINTYSGGTTLHNGNIYLNATSLPDGTVVGGGALYLTNGSTVGTLTGLATNVLGGIFSIDSGSTVNTNLDLYQGGTGTGTFMSGVGGGTIGGSLNLGPLHQAAVAPTMTPVAVAVNTILNSTALNVTGTISSLLGLPSFPILTAGTVTSWPYASTAFNGLTTTTLYTVSYLPLGAPTSINLKFALPATVFINTAGDGATPTPPAYNFRSALESGANVGFSPVTDMNGQSADLSTTNVTVGSATSTNIILDISNLTTGGFTVDGGGTLGLMDGGAASTLAIISTGGTPGTLYLNNMVNTYTGGTELHSGNVYLSNTTLPDGTQVGGGNLYLTKSSTVGTVKGVATTVSGGIFSIDSGSKVNTDLDLSQSGAGTGTFISGVGGGEIFGSLLLGPTHQAMVGLNTVPIVVRGLQGVDLTNGSVGTAIDVYLTGGQSLSNLKGKAVPILTAPQGVTGKYTSTSLAGTPTTTLYTVDYTDGITLEFGSAFIPLTGAYPEGPTTQNSNGYNTAVYLDFLEPTATGDLLSVIDVLEGMLASGALTDTQLALAQINPSSLAAQGWAASFYAQLITEFGAPQVQLWLSEGGGAPVSTSLAMVDSGRLAAFGKLVTHQTMNLNSASNICNNPRKTPLRKGVVTKESFFTNSGTEVNRHPLTAGRVQMGKANVWVQPYGQVVNQKGNGNGNPGVHNQTGGFSLGADYEIAKNTLVGVLGGAATTSFTWGQGRGNGGMNGGYGGLYGAWKDEDGFYISGQTIFGGNRFTTNRNINFSTINRTATGKHNAFQFSGDLEMGYTLPIYDWFTCQPFILADYMVMREAGYVETGAQSLNMAINAKTSQFLQAEIGAMVYKVFAVDDVLLRPMAELGWMQQRALGSTTNVNGALAGQPGALAVTGVSKIYNQIAPGVGLIAQFVNGLYVSGNVYGEFGGGLNIGEALIRVGYEF